MSNFDTDGLGTVDYTEFIAACLSASAFTEEARLKDAFTHFDINHDGTIDKDELYQGMHVYDMTMKKKDTDAIFD